MLFAGLFAERGVTVVEEAIATRDHTERMLQRAGVPVDRRPGYVGISPVRELVLPGDRGARRLLVGGAVHRGRHHPAGLAA